VRTHASIVWRHAGIGEFGEFGEFIFSELFKHNSVISVTHSPLAYVSLSSKYNTDMTEFMYYLYYNQKTSPLSGILLLINIILHCEEALKFCFKTCVAMKFVDDDDDDDEMEVPWC